jgi:predicted MPP superfamily phosphohydrolase
VLGTAWELSVRRHRLNLPRRCALLTDVHLDRLWVGAGRLARALDREGVEVVLLGGDYFDRPRAFHAERLDRFLRQVLGGRPALAVLGNHDHRLGPRRIELVQVLSRHSTLLRNAVGQALGLCVYGYDDPVTLRAARALPPRGVHLVMAHSPDLPVPVSALPAPLVCGHYHGGQVRILPRRLLARVALRHEPLALEEGVLEGWAAGGRVYVSRGLGMSHVSWRWGAAPEVAVFL